MDKPKKIDPSIKDCAYCETSGAKLTCAKCKAAHYCSQACQKQHWKNGHKGRCVAPDKRRPQAPSMNPTGPAPETAEENISNECPICLEVLSQGTLCTLPCQHDFHRECVEELRKHGVLQACPLCRTDLSAGPEKLFEDATRMYLPLRRKVESGKASWLTLTASEKNVMADVVAMLTTAANQGYAIAQYNLGVMYGEGKGVSQDLKEAVRWFRKTVDQGSSPVLADAQYNLGVMYGEGKGVSQDLKEALQWYRKAADQGQADAQFSLGVMYRNGKGVSQDFKEAMWWTRKAADQGHADAQYNPGVMFSNGEGVSQDFKEALQWYRKAASQGQVNAQFNIGVLYRDGKGVSQDLEETLRWYRKAADQGHADAQYNLSLMYVGGQGVSQDLKEAARLMQNVADRGHADAQYNLGAMYRDGKGVSQDLKEAARWFRKAADQDDANSLYILGVMHWNGEGASQDLKEATRWFQKAADQGHVNAQETLKSISHLAVAAGESSTQCSFCGRGNGTGVKLKPCSRCKSSFYCGADCQLEHWKKGHKLSCTPKE